MDLGLTGRTVIVTGASGGLGRHIARGFAAEGADVVLTYNSSPDEAVVIAKALGERALVVQHSLSDAGAPQELVERVLAWTGRIDVLVNNAVSWGATGAAEPGRFEDVSDDAWSEVLRLNIDGAVRLSRTVAPVMRRRRWGRLVHVSSTVAEDGMIGGEYYATAKAALHGFSRSAAFSLGGDGDILSNVVMPGLTRTDTNPHIIGAAGDHYASLSPIGRLLEAGEVATAVVYLGSAANTGVTGQVIRVSGGA